jgi:hypothetical protein
MGIKHLECMDLFRNTKRAQCFQVFTLSILLFIKLESGSERAGGAPDPRKNQINIVEHIKALSQLTPPRRITITMDNNNNGLLTDGNVHKAISTCSNQSGSD